MTFLPNRQIRQIEKSRLRRQTLSIVDARAAAFGRHSDFPWLLSFTGASLRQVLTDSPGGRQLALANCHGCHVQRWCVDVLAVRSNGVRVIESRCLICGYRARQRGAGPDELAPLWKDAVATAQTPCERCGATEAGVEVHHWAPRHLFDDADNWPVSYLCRSCHTEWHQVVTPDMSRRISA